MLAYAGTWSWLARRESAGVHGFGLDPDTGALEPLGSTAIEEPSHIAVSSAGVLYAATHASRFRGEPGSAVAAFSIDAGSGRLTVIDERVMPATHACYVSLDHAERVLLIANGMGGAACVIPLEPDGRLRPVSDVVRFGVRPKVPIGCEWRSPEVGLNGDSHPHCVRVDPTNTVALVSDLVGGRLWAFDLMTASGTLRERRPRWIEARGARHFEFHPEGRTLYVCDQRGSLVRVFSYDTATATLEPLQQLSTLPREGAVANTASDVHVHPSGRFVYVSNRGHDSIAVFAVEAATGRLVPTSWHATGGRTPRAFIVIPGGRIVLVANQDSSTITAFSVDPVDGTLARTGASATVPCPTAIAVATPPEVGAAAEFNPRST